MNKSKSSKCATLAVASSKTQSKLLQTSGDIIEVKSSNNGKSATIVFCPTGRALKVEGDKVSSIKAASRSIGQIMDECRRLDRCFVMFHMNSENGQKIAKVTSAKSVKRHGDNAIEINLSAKDLTSSGATAIKATSFSDLQEEKNVSFSFTWNEPEEEPEEDSLFDLVKKDEKLSTLEAALKAADLDDNLDDQYKHYTLLAPLNAAFAKLSAGTVADWFVLKNKGKLEKLLQKHVVEGKFDSAKLRRLAHSATRYITAIDGTRLSVKMRGNNLLVGGAKVVDADVEASNGVMHIIGEVLCEGNC